MIDLLSSGHSSRWRWFSLGGFLLITFAAAGIGSLFTAQSVSSWYQLLEKPSWTPPDWLFGPVWTVLYLSMAVSAWLVWNRRADTTTARLLVLYFIQLALNTTWSILFFGLKQPGWAMVDIVLLWICIGLFVVASWRESRAASILFIPYWAWVSYAATLNGGIWLMNS